MSNLWWRLPGPEKFLQSVITDIRSGRNVILCLPETIDCGLADILHRGVTEAADLFVRRLKYENGSDPLTFLYDNLLRPVDIYIQKDISSLLTNVALSRTLVIVNNSSNSLKDWAEFLQAYQHLQKQVSPIDRCLICLVHQEVYPGFLPRQDTCLAIHAFVGLNSGIDLEFYLHQSFNREAESQDIITRLIVSIAGQIVTDDPELCEILVREDLSGVINPFDLLKELCRKRDWIKYLNLEFRDNTGKLDKQLINYGLLSIISGNPKLHPCFLITPDRKIELVSRIWSGQVRVLLPHLEITRHKMLNLLVDILTIPHHKKLNGVTIEIDNLYDLEFGDIEYQLIDKMRNRHWYPEKGIINLVGNLKKIRNSLSHLTPVDADLILDTVKMIDNLQ